MSELREEEAKVDFVANLSWERNEAINALKRIKAARRGKTAREIAERALKEIQ